jgi:hypothetical protein
MVDGYTKMILTVIAVALSVIAVHGVVSSAGAQDDGNPVHVILDQIGPNMPLAPGQAVPVQIQAQNTPPPGGF